MTRTPARWWLGLVICAIPFLTGCALLPARPATLEPGVVRSAIERATLVRLDHVAPPPAANGLQSMRASMSGNGRGGTVAALVFWGAASSAAPLGSGHEGIASVQTTRLPGGLLALRRLNVVVLYARGPTGPDLTASLRRALAGAPLS
ncbi:MAG TPA: hypothetical protein VNY31_07655 [Solirubrobacteraceae bacterium]|jgi:hypothetical protein|nr:hypothetical protein [Solirubrobacteraceae bacterium]